MTEADRKRPRIAIFAPQLVPSHPAGSRMNLILQHLSEDFDFTVYGMRIDDRLKQRVAFVKIPVPVVKPRIVTYIIQFVVYGLLFWILRFRGSFDLIHAVESVSPWADVITMQYCGGKVKGLRKRNVMGSQDVIRSIYYAILYTLGSWMEGLSLKSGYLRSIVAVSEGLRKDITCYYGPRTNQIVIANPIEMERFENSKKQRNHVRAELGIDSDDWIVGVTCALGDWERKGLVEILAAYTRVDKLPLKLIVVGPGAKEFCERSRLANPAGNKVLFVGMTDQVEKYYGASDFFILASSFEGWPIVALEAASAGLPIVGTRVNGLEEFIEEKVNGYFVERTPESIAEKLAMLVETKEELKLLGENAKRKVQKYNVNAIVQQHRQLYQLLVTTSETKS